MAAGALALAQSFGLAGTVAAQTGNFVLELNNTAEVDDSCRLTFVATNNAGVALTATSYEVAIFDADGRVSNLLVLEFGELPLAKTKVVQFDLTDKECSNVSRILVNSTADCQGEDGPLDFCLTALVTSTRTNILFGV